MHWTAADVPSQTGRVAIVTGANSGIGLETAIVLAQAGAQVVMACRSPDKASAALQELHRRAPQAQAEVMALDLADLGSVSGFAGAFAARHKRLDLLINNAGIMALPYLKTKDGFEMLFGTNHLGHFALTGQLFDQIRETPRARVVTLSSVAHRSGRLPLEDPHWERRAYSRSGAYRQSKLANLLFALELERRLRRANIDTISVAAHPGYAATNIVFGGVAAPRSPMRSLWNQMASLGNTLLAQPASQGALPTLHAATAPDIKGGDYIGPDGFIEFKGYPTRVKPCALALDEPLAAGLWSKSEEMTGVRFL